ncbi:MAG TPA: hypothetical protein VLL52_10445, partial [Anaerolineae bacterium]|nr:hypothetical protein [Anaerolineae bacterium]
DYSQIPPGDDDPAGCGVGRPEPPPERPPCVAECVVEEEELGGGKVSVSATAVCPAPLGQNALVDDSGLPEPIPEITTKTPSDDEGGDIDPEAVDKLLALGFTYRNAVQLCARAQAHFGDELVGVIDDWWGYIEKNERGIRSVAGFLWTKLVHGERAPRRSKIRQRVVNRIPEELRDIIMR